MAGPRDRGFEHPRLAATYDALEADRRDLDVCALIADELRAHRVLDVGCGTGTSWISKSEFRCIIVAHREEVRRSHAGGVVAGFESKLAYIGHALMENRHGLLVDFQLTQPTGTAEREVVPQLLYDATSRGM